MESAKVGTFRGVQGRRSSLTGMSKAVDAAADLLLVADEIRNDALRADWPIPILEVLQQPEIEIQAAPLSRVTCGNVPSVPSPRHGAAPPKCRLRGDCRGARGR